MDADSIDPGADEAVQRIQNSISRIDTRAQAHKEAKEDPNPITGILRGLAASAHLDTQSSALYEQLAKKDSVTAVLHEVLNKQVNIASTAAEVLRDKHGLHVDRPGYKVLKALAWHYEDLAEELKSLGEGDWSSKALHEIERVLRDSAPITEPNGLKELVRVNTNENSNQFATAVNTLAKELGWGVDEALEAVKIVLGSLRGQPYADADHTDNQD